MNIWFCHCEPLVLLDEEELPIHAIKGEVQVLVKVLIWNQVKISMNAATIQLGRIFYKKLFPSAFLHFGCCESRRGKICRVCIGAKNWRRIYKSSWTATASGSLDWSSWWRRGLIYAPKSVSWDLRLHFSKPGPCTEITMGARHWWSTCGLRDGVCTNPLVVWQGLAYEPMKGVMCNTIL